MTLLRTILVKDFFKIDDMKFFTTFILLCTMTVLHGQETHPVENGGVLLDGYDVVGYYEHMVVKGKEKFSVEINGRRLLFASEENLKTFQQSPERYTPAYGGWCAIAMVDKAFVVPDYTLYKIQDGALLFFSIRAFFNGLTEWDKDPNKNKSAADINYAVQFSK